MRTLKDQTVIAGIGQTEFSKASGRSELQLAAEAAKAAIADAGMTPGDIDGLVTFTQDSNDELLLMRSVGIPAVRFWSRTPHGGAGAHSTILHAALGQAARDLLLLVHLCHGRIKPPLSPPRHGQNRRDSPPLAALRRSCRLIPAAQPAPAQPPGGAL